MTANNVLIAKAQQAEAIAECYREAAKSQGIHREVKEKAGDRMAISLTKFKTFEEVLDQRFPQPNQFSL